jgi:hypothetical protein
MSLAVHDVDLGCEGGLGQIGQSGQHLASLVAVVVNGLFAQDDQTGLLFVHQSFEQFGHGQRLQFQVSGGLDQNAAVGTDGHRGAQGFLALGHAARDSDDFGSKTFFFQAHGFFDGDLVKGFMLILTLAMSKPEPSDLTRTLTF